MKLVRFIKMLAVAALFIFDFCSYVSAVRQDFIFEGFKYLSYEYETGTIWVERLPKEFEGNFLNNVNTEKEVASWLKQSLNWFFSIHENFLANRIVYEGVTYEYNDDGVVTITSRTDQGIIFNYCIEKLGVFEVYRSESSVYLGSGIDKDLGIRYTERIVKPEKYEQAKRNFHTLNIVGNFKNIPEYFLSSVMKRELISLTNINMSQSTIRIIGDEAFNRIDRNSLISVNLSNGLEIIGDSTLRNLSMCPNLDQRSRDQLTVAGQTTNSLLMCLKYGCCGCFFV